MHPHDGSEDPVARNEARPSEADPNFEEGGIEAKDFGPVPPQAPPLDNGGIAK